ncbi:MAG TPA: hydrogenase [Treponema sp.]|nr:MAG: hydrogenase [Treponema sp. GWC1_61_84]HCM26960.1 hydrogenase [Treponema sp.]
MAYALLCFPFVMAAFAALFPSNRFRPWFLPVTAAVHAAATLLAIRGPGFETGTSVLVLDPLGKIVALVTGMLFLFGSVYAVGYLKIRSERNNRVFVSCLLSFLGLATLVAWSNHLGLTWVAIEGTTLATAPLIYFNRTKRSIEATWKYLLVGSVGIALALLGTFFLAYALLHEGIAPTLDFAELRRLAPDLSKPWLRAAFVLLLIGYGTKMGLAPMQTWKPDAYGEAPGLVGAILAAGVTSCAFLAFLRIYAIVNASGEGAYASRLLLFMGLLSMAVAGLFMLGQKDFKRMLAYSSVEHMGILMIGLGVGKAALFGTLLHVMTNASTKGVLFLSAANIHRAYDAKTTDEVRGAIRRQPVSGILFLAGFIAITGSPPFGPFVSEFAIVTGAFASGNFLTAALFLVFLLVVFIGMGKTTLRVVQGDMPEGAERFRDTALTLLPIFAFMALVLMLGLHIPAPLRALIEDAVRFLEVGA